MEEAEGFLKDLYHLHDHYFPANKKEKQVNIILIIKNIFYIMHIIIDSITAITTSCITILCCATT